jgi:hypothetical protein
MALKVMNFANNHMSLEIDPFSVELSNEKSALANTMLAVL